MEATDGGLTADIDTWVAIVTGLGGLALGAVLSAVFNLRDRVLGSQARRGDLAAVAIRGGTWFRGDMPIRMEQVGPGQFVDEQDAAGFPMTVTNGSGEKVTSVEFGIRWREGSAEARAAFTAVLLPGDTVEGVAWEAIHDPESFEPREFDEIWLERLAYFVRFTDQRGGRWENVLVHEPRPGWTSSRINGRPRE